MARAPKFIAPVTYTKRPLAGITLYQNTGRQDGASIEEMLDELEKSDILSARKELLLGKLRERGVIAQKTDKKAAESKLKRYLVDSDTGKITVDEEDGELTYKDAQIISASIKGKTNGGLEQAIDLLTALKMLTKEEPSKVAEKPKEYYVNPNSGVIEHDPENGEYTLSEARSISQSMQKGSGPKEEAPPTYVVDDGEVRQIKAGEPLVIKKTMQQPARTFFLNEHNELVEQEAGKPILIKIQPPAASGSPSMLPFPAMGRNGEPVYDKDGKPVYVDIEPQLKWLNFQNEQRRSDGRHDALMGLVKTVRENFGDGVAALKAAAGDIRGNSETKQSTQAESKESKAAETTEAESGIYECAQCHVQFQVPPGNFKEVACPGCQKTYTMEELKGA